MKIKRGDLVRHKGRFPVLGIVKAVYSYGRKNIENDLNHYLIYWFKEGIVSTEPRLLFEKIER